MENLLQQALDKAGMARYTAKVQAALAGKQYNITGTKGQVVGFNEKGEPVAQGTESLVGPPGKAGANGKDGVSVTHSWNGSTLTVTSASGTSSADLRGPKGADGANGKDGAKGETGNPGSPGPKGDPGLFYGTCDTAADTAEKVVVCNGFTLRTGSVVTVKFTNRNLAASPTLNVNGSGAKEIYYGDGKPGRSGIWSDGKAAQFVYDGAHWMMVAPAFAEGECTASGDYSHAEGSFTEASNTNAHAEGERTTASGLNSHAEGCNTTASGYNSHAEGESTTASGTNSHAGGLFTTAAALDQTVIGSANVISNDMSDTFIVGKGSVVNGVLQTRANCFCVTYSGVYATGAHNTTGADYAELFEWADGNPDHEDRVGRFVTLEGEKLRLAAPEDSFILGIVSGSPSVVGDVYDDQWKGMFLTDIFGMPLYEEKDFPAELGPDGEVIIPAQTRRVQKVNPDYHNEEKYIPRTERPEWDAVGMLGKLVALDDGTCQPDGWCRVGPGGIAAASAERTRYRVMARLDDTHVRVLIL